jgi:hypothetical protein
MLTCRVGNNRIRERKRNSEIDGMTAEIAILNKEAIALAADSAMTAELGGGRKVFTSATKIFTLCKNRPVGVMVYNNAQFLGVPWETVIWEIGKQVPGDGFKSLDEYVRLFLSYFGEESYLFTGAQQKECFMEHIYYCCVMTKRIIDGRVAEELKRRRPLSERSIQILVSKIIKHELNDWIQIEKDQECSSIKKEMGARIMKYYRSSVEEVFNRVFQKIPMSKDTRKKIMEILKRFISFGHDEWRNAGVVIAGFGEQEAFPALRSFSFEGIFNGSLKYFERANTVIGKRVEASILAFAQGEMVSRFMEGVDPDYREAERKFMSGLSEKFPKAIVKNLRKYNRVQRRVLLERIENRCNEIFNEYRKGMEKEIKDKFVRPITEVVAILPKTELATLAEALVNLTSIKRKFSSGIETVAEPIDVLVISKSDGFVWMKKKRYD